MLSSRKGFTLIELIIVMVIIGILASVATPMLRGNVDRAKKTEAVAAMGAIRTAERLYFAEHGVYAAVPVANFISGSHGLNAYIQSGDLTGTFFNERCYLVETPTTSTFTITCNTNNSTTARNSESKLGTVIMDDTGDINGY